MKVSKSSLAILGASFLLATAAFAGPSNKGKLHLAETVTVDGKQLTPGNYDLQWTGTGSDAKLNISKGKDTVASVPANVNSAAAHVRDGYGSKTEADGSKSLTSIFVGGKDIEIGQQSPSAATPAR